MSTQFLQAWFKRFWEYQMEIIRPTRATKWGIGVLVLPFAPLVGLWMGLGNNILSVFVSVLFSVLWLVLGGGWDVVAAILTGMGTAVLAMHVMGKPIHRHGGELLKVALPMAAICYAAFVFFL